jgi:mono/diheme cytochrome c family protein
MIARLVIFTLAFVVASAAQSQQPAPPQLDPNQTQGRALFSKSCTICHLPPQLGAGTFGPQLSRATLDGNESILRDVISNGMPHMPGFKHMYQADQIDSIVAYLKTVPAPTPIAPTPAR